MSDFGKLARKTGKWAARLTGAAGGFLIGGPVGAAAGYKAGDIAAKGLNKGAAKLGLPGAKAPDAAGDVQGQPGIPTIDMAAANQAAVDRIRMRRGVLQNIYGGSGGAAPSVGTKSLMGQ